MDAFSSPSLLYHEHTSTMNSRLIPTFEQTSELMYFSQEISKTSRNLQRERERERQRQTETDRQTDRQRQRRTGRDRDSKGKTGVP